MNSNELRIGNLILDHNNRICKVETIGLNNTVRLSALDGSYKFESVSLNVCSPIQLTSEILKKYGFKKDGVRFIYNDTAICCYFDGVEYIFKYGYDSDLSIASCEYFHQLQNLIHSLTCKELIINF